MLLRIPFIGLFRFEPFRDLKRIWLWLTAPKSSRVVVHSLLEGKGVQLRTLTDGDLILCLHTAKEAGIAWAWLPAGYTELLRRGLLYNGILPQWVRGVGAVPRELGTMAEKLLRPWAV